MNQRTLGQTGMAVSELCLGTMNFGWTIGKETAYAILDAYREANGMFLQAVSVCPDIPLLPATTKAPEEWIAEWIRQRGLSRSDFVLSSRMTIRAQAEKGSRAVASYVRRSVEDSLKRLNTDVLDLLICEWQRSLLPFETTLEALQEVVSAGLVRHVAAANIPLWRTVEAIHIATANQLPGFSAVQLKYSALLQKSERTDIADLCGEYNLGLLATSTLGGVTIRGHQRKLSPDCTPISMRHNASVEQLALAWALATPQVTATVIGVSSTTQLEQLVDATAIELSADEVATIGG